MRDAFGAFDRLPAAVPELSCETRAARHRTAITGDERFHWHFPRRPDHERQVLQAIRDPVFRTLQVTVH